MIRPPPISTLVPYTTLFRSLRDVRRYELPKIDHGCDGFPVNVICRVPGMPDRGTVRRWERHNPEFRRMIQRGREFGADTLAAEVVEIADAATPQSLQIARNRIQARNPCVVVCFRLCRRWFARWPRPRHQTCPAVANGFGARGV